MGNTVPLSVQQAEHENVVPGAVISPMGLPEYALLSETKAMEHGDRRFISGHYFSTDAVKAAIRHFIGSEQLVEQLRRHCCADSLTPHFGCYQDVTQHGAALLLVDIANAQNTNWMIGRYADPKPAIGVRQHVGDGALR